jgi:hypothetical protein
MTPFSTAVLDQAIAERRAQWEVERKATLDHLLDWLDDNIVRAEQIRPLLIRDLNLFLQKLDLEPLHNS